MGEIRKIAGQTVLYGLSSIVPRFLNYLLVPLYTNIFPRPAEYGVVTELYTYAVLLLIVLTYGMETAFFRYSNKQENTAYVFGTSFLGLLITTSAFLFLTIVFLKPISQILEYQNNPEYIFYFALMLSFDTLCAIPFTKLRLENKVFKFASLKILNVILNIFFNLFFLILCPYLTKNNSDSFLSYIYNPSIGIGYIFIANVLSSSIIFICLLPVIFSETLVFKYSIYKNMLKYAIPLFIAGLAGSLNETIDRILLVHLLPDIETARHQLGIYGANIKIAVLMTLFTQAFRYAFEPYFFQHHAKSGSRQVYGDIMKYYVLFGLFIFMLVTQYLDIFKYFINSTYHEGLFIVPFFLISYLLLGIMFNLSVWYKLQDKTRFGLYITLIGLFVSTAINVLFIPKYGYFAATFAHFIAYIIMVIVSFYFSQKYFSINYHLKDIGLYFLLTALLYFISLYVHSHSRTISILIHTLIFFIFVFVIILKEKLYKIRIYAGKNNQ